MDAGVRLAGKRVLQGLDRARFADPGLADQRHDLTLARSRQPPAIEQQAHFMGAADQRQLVAGAARRKAAFDGGFAGYPPDRHRA